MEAEAAKFIGAGLATFGLAGTALGLGNIFGNYLAGALRNPSAADSQFGRLVFGFAVTEALGIFSFLVALPSDIGRGLDHGLRAVVHRTFRTRSESAPWR
jgi:F-type H+-transporting ATPase subunit c